MMAYSPVETARAAPPGAGTPQTEPPAQKYRVAPSGEAVSPLTTPLPVAMRRGTRPLEGSARAITLCGAGPLAKAISCTPANVMGAAFYSCGVPREIGSFPFPAAMG